MRIAIDCFKLVKGAGKSIGIYNLTLNLVRNLISSQNSINDDEIKKSELIVMGNQYNRNDFEIPGVNFFCVKKYDPLNKFHCIIWELFLVSLACKKLKADRVLFPRGFSALMHPVKDFVIIHDMIPFYYHEHYPDYFNKLENAYIMNRLKASAKRCHKIITISESSKKEIIKCCNVDEKKICVIHNGCNDVTVDNSIIHETNTKPYIFAITSQLPHKNAKGIFEAYKRYCEIAKEPLDLIVVGVDDTMGIPFTDQILRKISCYKYISQNSDLYTLMAGAKVFLFISLVEGFGFPPIEAMQLGVPVICSNVSSLPEVVGDAAMLVNPMNEDEIASKLVELTCNESLINTMIIKGKLKSREYSSDSMAKFYWKTIIR